MNHRFLQTAQRPLRIAFVTCLVGIGDLDECNGRFCKTPEFPQGTYAYFLTSEWPVIPRAFRGEPINLR